MDHWDNRGIDIATTIARVKYIISFFPDCGCRFPYSIIYSGGRTGDILDIAYVFSKQPERCFVKYNCSNRKPLPRPDNEMPHPGSGFEILKMDPRYVNSRTTIIK